MLVKVRSELLELRGDLTLEQLQKKMKKPHLCLNCSVKVCVMNKDLESFFIKDAIKAEGGVYVISCDNYAQGEDRKIINYSMKKKENERVSLEPSYDNVRQRENVYISSPSTCNILHPNVRSVFLRR